MMKKIFSVLILILATVCLSAQSRVIAPELIVPEDADDSQMPDQLLDWDAVTGGDGLAITYEIQIDVDNTFTNPQVLHTDVTSIRPEMLLFGTEYFWRVKATDGVETSDWSEIWSFSIFDDIDLTKPSNNSDENDVNEPIKIKNRIGGNTIESGCVGWEIYIDTTESFDSPAFEVYTTEFVEGDYEFAYDTENLLFGTKYFWKARIYHDLDKGEWSDVWNFEIIFFPELDDPGDEDDELELLLTLEWDEIKGVLNYEVQVDDNANFTSPDRYFSNEEELEDVDYFLFGSTYYWRVRANHLTDTSQWSETWSFETINVLEAVSPLNDALNVERLPQLSWEPIAGTDSYNVQLSAQSDFNTLIVDETLEGDETEFYQVSERLEEGTDYFWRVRGTKGVSNSDWTETIKFKVMNVGIEDIILSESSVEVYPNPSHGDITISLNATASLDVNISVIDLIGKEYSNNLYRFTPGHSEYKLDLNNLASGIYMLQLESNGRVFTKKFIIEK